MRVLIAGDRPQDRDRCRQAALGVGLDCAGADCIPLAELRLRLAREPAVHFVVVLAAPDLAAAAQAIKYAVGHTGRPVLAALPAEDADAQALAEQAGAAGVATISRMKEELLRVSENLRTRGTGDYQRGRVVAVTAATPGSGATTVASGLAFGLAGAGSVLLTELGTSAPELALDLDLNPPHSLAELIRESDRMDAGMIRHAVARDAAGIDVLAYLPDTLLPEPLSPTGARDFQILLRNMYDWVVVDAGHPQGQGTETLCQHADTVVIVTRLDPPSLRLTRKYFEALAGGGVPVDAITIVANRYGQPGLVPWQKAQEALKATVRAWLPDDPRSVNRGLVEGRPLVHVAKRSRLTRELGKLAADVRTQLTAGSAR